MLSKSQLVSQLKEGDVINDIFAVKFKKPVQAYAGETKYRFELRIGDASGEIMLKYWGKEDKKAVSNLYESIREDDVILVQGKVGFFHDALEIGCNEGQHSIRVMRHEDYDAGDFIPKARNIDRIFKELVSIISEVKDAELKSVLSAFFSDKKWVSEFGRSPAALYKHHACIGGLMEHTLQVARLCLKAVELQPELDKDMLITGAFLHDIGKMREFKVTSSIKMSNAGMLLGHIVLGFEDMVKRMPEIDKVKRLKLLNMMVSHHGHLEYGCPKLPATPEALALYHADEMSAKLDQMLNLKKEALTEDDFAYSKDFGNVFLR